MERAGDIAEVRMKARTLFITGTDTGVGKTFAGCALLRRAGREGLRVAAFKPVASGCTSTPQGLRNDDALALRDAAVTDDPYDWINPYAFEPPVAPHLAAQQAGRRVQTTVLDAAHAHLSQDRDLVLVEGAGGWLVPLNEDLSFAAWVEKHNWPVILVVGMRLGCLNHALLSAENIARRTRLAGWIANALPPQMDLLDDNIESLRRRLPAPLLGVLTPDCTPERAAELLQLPPLAGDEDDDEGLP